MPRTALDAAIALLALFTGFLIEGTSVGQLVGEAVAYAIAVVAGPVLWMLGTDVVRSGVELRAIGAGWAVRVSEVCNGMGLVVALLAAVFALGYPGRDWGRMARQACMGLAVIQVFNLLRVVALALSLDHWPAGFDVLHDVVFPFVTVAVIGVALVPAAMLGRLILLALPFAILWPWITDVLSPLLVPPANLLLSLGPPEWGEIAKRGGAWSVGTFFLAGSDPVSLFVAPLDPRDFTVALPVILAAALIARAPLALPFAIMLMLVALVLAAGVSVWLLAEAEAPVTVLLPDGTGAFVQTAYHTQQTALALFRHLQNTVVHFLLLVLPFLILANRRRAL